LKIDMAEKVLLVCTSNESNVNKALQVLKGRLFQNPQLDFLCTATEWSYLKTKGDFRQVFVFPGRHEFGAALKLWRRLTKEKYDVLTVLWCLDLGRFRSKLFALCCGGRRILVFNEHLDCDYLSLRFLKNLLMARASNGTLARGALGRALLTPIRDGYWGALRAVVFPLRLLVLLLAVAGLYLGKRPRRED
jgi:hypothetical protein